MNLGCYVCHFPAGKYGQRVDPTYSVFKCRNCGLEYTYPIPTDDILEGFYAEYKDIRADEKIVRMNACSHLKLLGKYGWTPESWTLDYGAGPGVFVEIAGKNCFGLDSYCAIHPRVRRSMSAFAVVLGWRFITLWGVLEHLVSPYSTIATLTDLLPVGGIIALTTVDAEGIIPYHYKPPEHLTYWTRAAFDILADKCGLKIVDYERYMMSQLSDIYLDRLLSRTPKEYRSRINHDMPGVIRVPTNEVRVVMQKNG